MKQLKTVGVLSLGCPRNLVDSEYITGRLSFKGYKIADIGSAEVCIVNTCAFIDEARRESIETILDLVELKERGKLKKIIVYGCLTQRYKDKLLKELPEIDAFVGCVSLNHSRHRYPITPKHFAYLKICEGCINNCSFCIIPKLKGQLHSLSIKEAVAKVRHFDKEKVAEINIIGQDISAYGKDLCSGGNLAKLLVEILKAAGNIGWIRLLYLQPSRIDNELIGLIKKEPKLCKYIDMPLQHINNRILKLMNRDVSRDKLFELIDKIRKELPEGGLRTSIIVGFPFETDKEFKELLKFIEEVKFERLGAFIYSKEEGTPAAKLKGQIPKKVKIERFNELMKLQQGISEKINSKFLGKTIDVLIDEQDKGLYLGRSQFDAPEVDGLVYLSSPKKLMPGDFVKAKITDTLEYDLVGEAITSR